MDIKTELLLFSKNGTEMNAEDFYHIDHNDIIYVKNKCKTRNNILDSSDSKFSYKAMLGLYQNIGKLGEGGFGSVYLYEHKISGEKVAAKFMNVTEYLKKANEIEKALKESTSLISLDHPQIIKFETAFLIDWEIVLFTEYMPGGELGKYVKSHDISEKSAKQIFKLILEPVQYCHNHGIIHRDLKLENILLEDPNNPKSLKIIDFGIAGIWSIYGGEISTAGTLYYTPPEVINGSDWQSDPKIDIWSLGVILFIILTKLYPFKGKSFDQTRELILEGKIPFESKAERKLSKEAKHLLSMLLWKDKNRRYTMREIASHPWLDEVIDYEREQTPLTSLKSAFITEAIIEEIRSWKYPTVIGKLLAVMPRVKSHSQYDGK
jgi:serine/threonine protein kinase